MSTLPRLAEFTLVRRGADTQFRIRARRSVRTLEGRLADSWLARTWPIAVLTLLLVTAGELATLFVSAKAGISVHALALVGIATHAALLRRVNPALSRMMIAVTPAPLIRIVSLTSPLAQFSYIQWFTVLAIIIYAGIVAAIKILKPDLASIGLRLPERRHWPLEIAVVAGGFLFGFIEYYILKPGALVPDLSFRSLVAPVIVLYVSTGLLEELLFRGMIQRYAGLAMGTWLGIGFSILLFAVLHTGWDSLLDVLFVGAVAAIYSTTVLRTRSIIGVSISHGVTNAMLFLVMPILTQ